MRHAIVILAALSVFSTAAFAEEAPLKEAYGMVKSIADGKMVVTVYDKDSGQAADQTFSLSPQTQLVIVRPANEVVAGDEVRINYQDGKDKSAAFVSILDLPAPQPKST
ncbi:MAG TPA: hypothetical protein VL688_05925 [Verrucomicrobiae bacterium]|jgi:hypothetical protein|nr:hypothetical protein [Verrucomicrobiae bacterium]